MSRAVRVIVLATLVCGALIGATGPAASPPARRAGKAAARSADTTRARGGSAKTSAGSVVMALPDTARPVFTGAWTLDSATSEFGNIPGGRPNARTDVIEHTGTRIRQVLYLLNGSRHDTTTYVYSTDGVPTVNAVDGRDITSVVTWEGRDLHLVSKTRLLVFTMSLDERWRMGVDGRTLVMTRHVVYPLGEGDQRLVFARR